ncbi:hypothetical protein [Rhodoferax sp.]|uniref:hypothetical protein n=1 Tax=Rhodoferax sp. TaxID=50421 RepID=UPI0025DFD716|nr:hypothetical protein [Rhodoferax sp.]
MNFEPFMPFEPSEPLVPPAVVKSSVPKAHYFDRVGLVWIVACVLFATSAGQLLPKLAEPDGVRNTLVALGVASARPVETAETTKATHTTTVASLPPQGANPSQPTRATQAKQEAGPLVSAVLRQF